MATLTLELPDVVLSALGSPELAATKVRQSLVLDLLRMGQLSQGQAAEALGLTRWELLDQMRIAMIETGPVSTDELEDDLKSFRNVPSRRAP